MFFNALTYLIFGARTSWKGWYSTGLAQTWTCNFIWSSTQKLQCTKSTQKQCDCYKVNAQGYLHCTLPMHFVLYYTIVAIKEVTFYSGQVRTVIQDVQYKPVYSRPLPVKRLIKKTSQLTPFTPFFSLSSMNRDKNSGDFPLRLRKCSNSCKRSKNGQLTSWTTSQVTIYSLYPRHLWQRSRYIDNNIL